MSQARDRGQPALCAWAKLASNSDKRTEQETVTEAEALQKRRPCNRVNQASKDQRWVRGLKQLEGKIKENQRKNVKANDNGVK